MVELLPMVQILGEGEAAEADWNLEFRWEAAWNLQFR